MWNVEFDCVEKPAEYDGSLNAKYENAVAVFSVDCRMDYFLNNDLFVYMELSAFFSCFFFNQALDFSDDEKEREAKQKKKKPQSQGRKKVKTDTNASSEWIL